MLFLYNDDDLFNSCLLINLSLNLVVWNPWVEKAKAMSDFGDDEYNTMICVEAGYVQNRCILKPYETTVMGQEIVVELNC